MNLKIRYASALTVCALLVSPAHGAIYKDVGIGMSLLGYNFFGQRNYLGDGFTVNAAAFYNNRTFNFGFADLTLNGQMSLSADLTRRGIPAVGFTASSGGAPLNYSFDMNTGIQDFRANGSVLVNVNTKINALGFYTNTFQIANKGTYATQGLGLVDSGTLNFDAGPINVSGNIYADALAAVTEPFFAATGTVNPFAKFSGKAQKAVEASKNAEDLRARIQAGEVLSDEDMSALINNTVLAAMLGGQPDSKLFDNILLPAGLLENSSTKLELSPSPAQVPEPGSLFTFAIALPLLRPRQRLRAA